MRRPTRQPFRGRLIRLGQRAKNRLGRCAGVVAAACTQGECTQHGKPHAAALFNALYMNLIDCSAAMPPIARLYRVLATFSARLKRRMLAANERILAKTPGFLRIREASSAKLPSRT